MNKNVLVTGATRGLGLAVAERLKRDGYHVIGTGRAVTQQLSELMQYRQENGGGTVEFRILDLTDVESLHSRVIEIVNDCGPLYGLVNNAAIGVDGVLATMHDVDIAKVINTNVLGTIVLTKYAVRSMLLTREGRIVNISSIIATTGFSGLSVYAASKSAMLGFTRSLARELGKAGITVNSIAPGYMRTAMSGGLDAEQLTAVERRSSLKRLTDTRDVAGGVSYLLSADAAGITGTTLTIDCGSTA